MDVLGADGRVPSARRPAADGAPLHTISFDPPLGGTSLQISAYDRPAAFGKASLLGAIVVLAVFALLVVQSNALHRRRAEEALRDSLAFLIASQGGATKTLPSGEDLLAGLRQTDCACIILNARMEGQSGPQVLDTLVPIKGSSAAPPPALPRCPPARWK